jgi:hypothetical protein
MPRKDRASYLDYMRNYMAIKRQGLTGINNGINKSTREIEANLMVGATVQ